MKSRVHPKYKTTYRVGNWAEYDRALVRRGDVTRWLTPDAIATWAAAGVGRRSGQLQYSDLAIETALTLSLIFHVPLRQTEGVLTSIFGRLGVDLTAPITPRSRDAVSISPARVGAPARAPACTSSLPAPDWPSSAKVSGPRRHMGAEGDAAGGSSLSAWTGPV